MVSAGAAVSTSNRVPADRGMIGGYRQERIGSGMRTYIPWSEHLDRQRERGGCLMSKVAEETCRWVHIAAGICRSQLLFYRFKFRHFRHATRSVCRDVIPCTEVGSHTDVFVFVLSSDDSAVWYTALVVRHDRSILFSMHRSLHVACVLSSLSRPHWQQWGAWRLGARSIRSSAPQTRRQVFFFS